MSRSAGDGYQPLDESWTGQILTSSRTSTAPSGESSAKVAPESTGPEADLRRDGARNAMTTDASRERPQGDELAGSEAPGGDSADAASTASRRRSARSLAADTILEPALARGMSQAAAARLAHVSDRHVYNRLQDPEFAARVAAARERISQQVATRSMSLAETALDALEELLGGDQPPTLRLRAASLALRTGHDFRDDRVLYDRLDALDAALRRHEEQAP